MTKEELLKNNAVLEKDLQRVKDNSDQTRDILSKILGSVKNNQWGDDEAIRLSWLEIAYRIGLKDGKNSDLENNNFRYNFEQIIGELQQRIDKLEKNYNETRNN